jgi:opacity protein-like surface antigen
MRLKTLITGAAALSVISIPALAADVLPAPPPPEVAPVVYEEPPAFTWTGGYVGGHAGIGRGHLDNGTSCLKRLGENGDTEIPIYFIVEWPGDDLDWDQENFRCNWALEVGALGPTDLTEEDKENFPWFNVGEPTPIAGYLIGTQIGFNRQFGEGRVGFVIGAEVAFSMTSLASQLTGCIGRCFSFPDALPVQTLVVEEGHNIYWNSEFRINYLATATLRAGLAFGKALLYGEGGLALANATWTNTLGFSDTVTDHGYVFGAGFEAMISTNVSLFFEWNRVVIPEHRFIGQINLPIPIIGPLLGPLPTGIDVSSRTDIFKIGFNIRIGRDHPEI